MFEAIRATSDIFGDALEGLTQRQRSIANNIANADTPNFKASEVLFEKQLQEKIKTRFGSTPNSSYLTHPKHIPFDNNLGEAVTRLQMQTTARNDGNNVDLDLEMTKQAQANISYNAVSQILGGRYTALKSVIAEAGK